MSTETKKQKTWISFVGGMIGGSLIALIVLAIVIYFFNPYVSNPVYIQYDKALLYDGDTVNLAKTYEAHIIIEELKKQQKILTPAEFTANLGAYYNSLISIVLGLFGFFSLISFFTIKNSAKNEVKEALLEIDLKTQDLNKIVKKEVNEVLDEMLRDSKLMHDKLDQSIKGLITDALDESIASVPSIDSYNKLVEDISSLKKEQDTYLELLEEAINDRKISHEKVTI